MSPEVQERIEQKRKEMQETSERWLAIANGVCPECAGDLKKISGFWGEFWGNVIYACSRGHVHKWP